MFGRHKDRNPEVNTDITKHWGMPILFPLDAQAIEISEQDPASLVEGLAQYENDLASHGEGPAADSRVLTFFLDTQRSDSEWMGVCAGALEDYSNRRWQDRSSVNILAIRQHGESEALATEQYYASVGKFAVINCSGQSLTAFAVDTDQVGIWQSEESASDTLMSVEKFGEFCRDIVCQPKGPSWVVVVLPTETDMSNVFNHSSTSTVSQLLKAAKEAGVGEDFKLTIMPAMFV
jgi:hypothetical protein